MQPKYGSKVNTYNMDKDNFVCEIESQVFYKDIAEDIRAIARICLGMPSRGHDS